MKNVATVFRFRTAPFEDGVKITGFEGPIGETLVIPEEIDGKKTRRIADFAFRDCSEITSVAFPGSVREIGGFSFAGCAALREVAFSKGLDMIEDYAFYKCRAITNVALPESLTDIGSEAFGGCSLGTVRLPSGLEYCGPGWDCEAFEIADDGVNLKTIDGVLFDKEGTTLIAYPLARLAASYAVPDGVQKIGHDAFCGARRLESVTTPESLRTIGDSAFMGCDALANASFPDGLTTVGDGAFSGCALGVARLPASLENPGFGWGCEAFEISDGNDRFKTIDGVLFDKEGKTLVAYPCARKAKSYAAPENVREIGKDAFYCCDAITSVTLPASLEIVDVNAFWGCRALESVTFQEGLRVVRGCAFDACCSLKSAALPASLKNVSRSAFPDGTVLTAPDGSWAKKWIERKDAPSLLRRLCFWKRFRS